MSPLIALRGAGDRIFDADGHSYIDYCGSWGQAILGHAHAAVVEAAVGQMRNGSSFGIATEIEEKLAHKIISHLPSIEKIRFVSSGTEATMTAIRLARGVTSRSKIVKFSGCYHGHSDSLLIKAGSGVADLNSQATSLGIPPGLIADTICLPFNDLESVRKLFAEEKDTIACVIIEPIAGNMGVVPATCEFLQLLREETSLAGALLIFDEVITGFRVGLTGAQGLYGIRPDLTCLGKVIGGGFPVAAFGGPALFMDQLAPLGGVYQAGTLSGNPVAMHAGFETLRQLEEPGFYDRLLAKTNRLLDPVRKAILQSELSISLNQVGSMFTLFFGPQKVENVDDLKEADSARFTRFFRALFEKGIYLPPLQQEASFVSAAHTEQDLDFTAECMVRDFSNF
jgi:glutamate-1-semialdehyde 2,1-aminomutase